MLSLSHLLKFTTGSLLRPVTPLLSSNQREGGQLLINRKWIHTRQKLLADFNYYLNNASQSDAILIQCIKACGDGLLSEKPQKRVLLADSMIQKLKDCGFPSSSQIKNSLLQVYIYNRHKFSPSLFLQDMKEEKLLPNKGTMFLLLQAYCQQGNMEGAKEILQEIQANNIPINEEVYASLITCHAMRNEMAEAKDLLVVMKDAGLVPKHAAYSALLSGYAYHGDFESINALIAEMRVQRVYAGHSVYIEMLDALSYGGKSSRMKELLDTIRNKQWMYNDLIDKTQVFAGRGDLLGTQSLLECLVNIETAIESTSSLKLTAAIALRLLTSSGLKFSELLPSISVFEAAGLSLNQCYEIFIKRCFDEKNWDDLKWIFDTMNSKGMKLKNIYFYPLLAHYGNKQDAKGLMQCLSTCKDFNIQIDINILFICLRAFNDDFPAFFKELLESELIKEECTLPYILELLITQKRDEDLNFFFQHLTNHPKPSDLPINELLRKFKYNLRVEANPEAFVTMVETLAPLCRDSNNEELKKVVHVAVDRVLHKCLPNVTLKFVESLLKNCPELISKGTCRLVVDEFVKKDNVTQLKSLIDILESYGMKFECAQHKLIIRTAHQHSDSADIASSSFKVLKQLKCPIDASTCSYMILAFIKGQKLNSALTFYNGLIKKKATPNIFVFSHLVNYLLSVGQFSIAKDVKNDMERIVGDSSSVSMSNSFIEAYGRKGDIENSVEEFELVKKPTVFTYQSLMVGYCYHGDVTGATEVFEKSRSVGLGNTRRMASTLFETYLNSNDLEGAVSLIEKFENIKPKSSTCIDLVNECVKQKRQDLTEKVFSFMTSLGQSQLNIDCTVTFAMMKSDQFEEGIDFLKSKQHDSKHIYSAVVKYVNDSSASNLVEAIELGIKLLDQLEIDSKPLVEAYDVRNNPGGILAVKNELKSSKTKKPNEAVEDLVDDLVDDLVKI